MTTDLVAGLREYVEALKEYVGALKNRESVNANLQALFKADERHIGTLNWLDEHASAIADELAMLAEEVKHLKPLAESTLAENERLRAEVEKMKEVGRKVLDHYLKQCYDCDGIPEEAWDDTETARALFSAALDAKGGG